MEAVESKQQEWKGTSFTNSYLETKQKSAEFTTYKNTDKRTWVAEKQDVDTLLGNIQTKLKTYDLPPYVPPAGLTLAVSMLSHEIDSLFHWLNISLIQSTLYRTSIRNGRACWILKPTITEASMENFASKCSDQDNGAFTAPLLTPILHRIKENLRKSYAQAANDFQKQLNATTLELVKLDGDLDVSMIKAYEAVGTP